MLIRQVIKINPISSFHFSVSVSNITNSLEQHGSKAFQFTVQERIPVLPLFNISKTVTFQVNVTVIEENAVIQNRLNLMGGILQIRQHWYVADSKNGSGDETLLEHHFEFTTARLLSRVVKRRATHAHNTMLKNIKQHFVETAQEPNDNIST